MKLFLDIDTQIDFLFPAGALHTPGAERMIAPVARLNRYAAKQGIPLISTMCAHPENADEFRDWAPHCVIGTVGQRKPAATLIEKGARGEQIIVEKNHLDVFTNPEFTPLLDKLGADEFFVYGVFIDYCVGCAITGLLKRAAKVVLVSDASASVDEEKGQAALARFLAAGLELTTIAELTAS